MRGGKRRPIDDLARVILGRTDLERTPAVMTGSSTDSGLTDDQAQGRSWRNPMTDFGDMIEGGETGAAKRLGVGTEGQVLTVVDIGAGELHPRWATATAAATGQYREYTYIPDGSGGIDLIDAGDGTAVYTLEDLE